MLAYHWNRFLLLYTHHFFFGRNVEKQSLAWVGGGEMPIAEHVAVVRMLLWAVPPIRAVQRRRDRVLCWLSSWVASKGWMLGGGITWTHLRWLSSPQPASKEGSRDPALTCTLLSSSLPSFIFEGYTWQLISSGGQIFPLVSFWRETYFSLLLLCSCTWQSGVCSAAHSLANLVS